MFLSLIASVSLLPIASLAAATGCTVALEGNMSPNNSPGSFEIVENALHFNPANVNGFNVVLQSCGTGTGAETPTGNIVAPSGQCLSVDGNSSVVGVDCSSTTDSSIWTMSSGFLFFSGGTDGCDSGLFGYNINNNTGIPSDIGTPITVGCSTDESVFPFSIIL